MDKLLQQHGILHKVEWDNSHEIMCALDANKLNFEVIQHTPLSMSKHIKQNFGTMKL